MVSHVVLFRLRRDLGQPDREAFAGAFEKALTEIPSIRGFRFGQRTTTGASYEQTAPALDFVASIDFDDVAGLQAYLAHPAHVELAALFRASIDDALVYDFTMHRREGLRDLVRQAG